MRVMIVVLGIALIGGFAAWGWRARRMSAPPPSAPPDVAGPVAFSGPTMGSTWIVRLLRLPPSRSAAEVQAAVQRVVDRVDQHMSTWKSASDLSRFNRSRTTDWFDVPEDVANVAGEARRVSAQTGGAFDVTVGPLVNLWGFGPEHPAGPFGTIPTDAAIDAAMQHVGYARLDVRAAPPALRKSDPALYADFSGIAKGYAADLVGRCLESMGISDYLVGVGGEMRARGNSTLGRPWRVGIETPTPGVRRILYRVELRNLSLSTSGDYRNYFDKDGRRYCHEIDPATGRPIAHGPASVSIAHTSGIYADAMATALMVLGTDKGYALAERLGVAAFFITRAGDHFETRATPQFQRLLIPAAESSPETAESR